MLLTRVLLLGLCIACVTPRAGTRGEGSALDETAEREAATLLQDSADSLFLPTADIRAVANDLRRIRARYSAVRAIHERLDQSYLVLWVTPEARRRLLARVVDSMRDAHLESTGIPELDSLNAALGATETVGRSFGRFHSWIVAFPRYPNVSAVGAHYAALPGVTRAGQELYLGGGDGIALEQTATHREYMFSRGWGDCYAGCINGHWYRFRVDRESGAVRFLGEGGDPLK
jgi:hypothetical protein